jgi:hypothetical protein
MFNLTAIKPLRRIQARRLAAHDFRGSNLLAEGGSSIFRMVRPARGDGSIVSRGGRPRKVVIQLVGSRPFAGRLSISGGRSWKKWKLWKPKDVAMEYSPATAIRTSRVDAGLWVVRSFGANRLLW